jgi:hypothetical protein
MSGARSSRLSRKRFRPSTPTGPMMSGASPAAMRVLSFCAARLLFWISRAM